MGAQRGHVHHGQRSKPSGRVVKLGRVIVWPVAAPAWAIERAIRRAQPNFEFGILSSVPYFSIVVFGTTASMIWVDSSPIRGAALVILTLLELVALGGCVVLAVSRPGSIQGLLLRVFKRRQRAQLVEVKPSTVVASLLGAAYTIWYFGALMFVISQASPEQYDGMRQTGSMLGQWWAAQYFAAMSFMSANSNASPARFLSELLHLTEVALSLFFFVFLLASIVSRYLAEVGQR